MPKTIQKHIAAIESGQVDATIVSGLRKALNAHERAARGYSVGGTSARMTAEERELILYKLLPRVMPRVVGKLHDSGLALLRGLTKRRAARLESVAGIVADLTEFRLVGFDYVGPYGMHATPVYRAYDSAGKSFPFTNVPWQSGGDGPELANPRLY
jgi:hypothetical protein